MKILQSAKLFSKNHLILLGILLVAFALRVYGNNFGLPYEYHVDEVQYVRQAASMGAEGLAPVWWNNPPFFKYLLLAEYGALFLLGRFMGWHASAVEFGALYSFDPSVLYLLGRTTSALFGTATVLLVYLTGKLAYGRRTGLIAAAFLAVTFLHVRESHFAVNDVAATFFVTLALLATVGIAKTGAWCWYGIAGLALGLGFATKYSAIFAAAPILVAHLLARYAPTVLIKPVKWRQLAAVAVIAAVSAVVASPYFVFVPAKVFQDAYEALYLAGQRGFDGWQIDPDGGYLFYLKTLVWGLGWPLVIVVFAGLMAAAVRHNRQDVVLLSLPVLLYLVAGRQELYFARFILPIVPPLLVLAAYFVDILVSGFFGDSGRWFPAAALATVLIITAPSLVDSLRLDYLLSQTDTRTLASRWIGENVAADAKIAVDWSFHGPPLSTATRPLPGAPKRYEVIEAGGGGLADLPLDWYRKQGFQYLITSSYISELTLRDAARNEQKNSFMAGLPKSAELVQEFLPATAGAPMSFIFDEIYGPAISLWQRERPGPVLRMYQIPP